MQQNDSPLPTFLKASWGVGALGTTSMLYLVNMFAVFFLVRHAGMPIAIATTILAATRFYDAVVDPLIGTLSDRTDSRWGRRRPWMLSGALLCPIACIAVFNPPLALEGTAQYGFVLFALLLYCTAYSLFSIPYMALGAEMTDHYGERASVMAWRTFFVYSAGVVIASGAPALVALLGGDRAAYASMSYGAAAVETLQRLGLLSALEPKFVQGENIAQTYQFAATGNADLGLVALAQVWKEGKLTKGSAWVVPADLHSPIRQDALLLAPGADSAAARALLKYLQGDAARAVIRAFGYDL